MPQIPFVERLSEQFTWAPSWVFSLIVIAVALTILQLGYNFVVRQVARAVRSDFARSLLARTRGPGRLALVIAAVAWGVDVAPVDEGLTKFIQHGLLVAFICLVGWVLMAASDIGSAIYLRRHRTDSPDNLHARKMLTQTRILRRSANVLIFIVTVAMALITIPGVKQVGVSLLAAGGAAGIILGLALQPLLSNIVAGIQIAFTQPIRIDDAVTVQNEFGHVEEIKATYVVIRLRDQRRMIVPLRHFLEQPFQNWTRDSSDLVPELLFQVDQRVPFERLRETVEEIVKASPRWDGRIVRAQINDIREKTLEIRVLVSVRNATDGVDLRAEVREGVIAWLQRDYAFALPRSGVEEEPASATAPDGTTRAGAADKRVQ